MTEDKHAEQLRRIEIGKRLENVRHSLELSKAELAAKLNFAPAFYYSMVDGKKKVNAGLLTKMYKEFNVNSNYLLFGIGNMYVQRDDRMSDEVLGKSLGKTALTAIREVTDEIYANSRFAIVILNVLKKFKAGELKDDDLFDTFPE